MNISNNRKVMIDKDMHNRPALTPAQAKAKFGATHYKAMRDGVTPQLYFKHNPGNTLSYLSFVNLWQGSNVNGEGKKYDDLFNSLIEIK